MNNEVSFPIGTEVIDIPHVTCPICGDAFVHPTVIDCITPGMDKGRVTITQAGIAMNPLHPPKRRGVWFAIRFRCEQGHEFEYQFQFHKGITFVSRAARDIPEGEDGLGVIWRD